MSVLDYDGKATWNLINLPVGTYPVFAVYNGNENYSTVNASGEFTVIPLSSWVNGIADDIFVGEDAIINISVIPNATGNVTITIENNTYTATIENGKAQFTVSNLKAGEKQVEISYNGDSIYAPSENTTTFTVNKIKPTITVDTYDIYVGDNETITITLPQDATGNLAVTIGNETYILTLENGEAKITLSGLEKGTYTIYVTYSGDDKYLQIEANSTFNVLERKNIEPHSDKHDVVPIGLGKYSTGYPILILLLALLATGFGVSFKRKK